MTEQSRRAFLRSAGLGAAAVGVATAGFAEPAAAAPEAAEPEPAADVAGTLIVHVRDAKAGTMALLMGDREVVVTDRALTARLFAAAR